MATAICRGAGATTSGVTFNAVDAAGQTFAEGVTHRAMSAGGVFTLAFRSRHSRPLVSLTVCRFNLRRDGARERIERSALNAGPSATYVLMIDQRTYRG